MIPDRLEASGSPLRASSSDISPDLPHKCGGGGITRLDPPEEVPGQHRIGQFQQPLEGAALVRGRLRQPAAPEALQEQVELLHAAAAAPQGPPEVGRLRRGTHSYDCLSSIIFLTSAMARAGFRSFGQASVQFMMVWHRYSRKGSSSSSSRSPVASSRLSMIQR